MSNYYSKRDAKVRIAEELRKRGWKIYGYKEDRSDSMTDYYSPADWDGIATKNGFTLVIDNKSGSGSGKAITRYNPNYKEMSLRDKKTIENLEKMTIENGATIGEAENAKMLIEKINNKYKDQSCSRYETIGYYQTFQANSKGCIWHIEKDGALVDRGNKLTIFADVPESYVYDIVNMEFKERYEYTYEYNEAGERIKIKRTLKAYEEKAIKEFKAFILRLERAVNNQNSCGDGTKETEEEGLKQQNKTNFEKVIETITKKVVKRKEVERKEGLKVGDVFFQAGKGNLKVISINENSYKVVKLGSKNRGYQESKAQDAITYWNKKSIDTSAKNEWLKIYNLVEVEEVKKIEKWVKIDNEKKSNKVNLEKKEDNKEELPNNKEVEITYNKDKNGIEVKFNNKPAQEVLIQLKENGFRWHRVKKVWYAKDTEVRRDFINSLVPGKEKEQEKKVELSKEVKRDTILCEEKDNIINLENHREKNIEEIEEDNNMEMNFDEILESFDNIEIKNKNRLCKEDLEEIEKLQEKFNDVKKGFKKYIEFYRENKLFDLEEEEVKILCDSLEEYFVGKIVFSECCKFISKIYNYFEKKYNITLEKKYHNRDYNVDYKKVQAENNLKWFMEELDYNLVLDDIFNQLNGVSFEDKEKEELKNEFEYAKPIIKSNNINMKNFIYFDSITLKYSRRYEISYNSREKIKSIFKLIDRVNSSNNSELCNNICNDSIDPIGTHKLNGNIITSIQIFKNGSIKLTCNTGLNALNIAGEYLNYKEVA